MTELITRSALNAQGLSQRAIDRQIKAGTLRRVRFSTYTRAPVGTQWEEYELVCRAVALTGNVVLSHRSAAALHRIPTYELRPPGPGPDRVHVTIDATGGGSRSAELHVHARPLRAVDVEVIDGVRVTSRARTAVDLAMSGDFGQALTAIDAIRLRPRYPSATDPTPVTVERIRETAAVLGSRPGVRMFRRALAHSAEGSESAGESRSRAMMIEWDLPAPQLQRHFLINGRDYFADFYWPGLVGEFDGAAKYRSDTSRAAWESTRAGDFRSIGIAVVNWRWKDLADRARMYNILTNEMRRCGVTDRVRPFPG